MKGVTIHGIFEITSMASRGVEEIKDTLLKTRDVAAELEAEAVLYSLGAPKYRVEVTADDYRKAEAALNRIVEFTEDAWSSHDGKVSFTRT